MCLKKKSVWFFFHATYLLNALDCIINYGLKIPILTQKLYFFS